MKPAAKITQATLDAWLEKWQFILRLVDWDIKIRMVRSFDIGDGKQGEVRWIVTKKKASITILDPNDFPTGQETWPQDVEQTIVHELVHVTFAAVDDFRKLHLTVWEQGVDAIAQALVDRDRA